MDWSKIAEIAISVLSAAGGIGVISMAVIKWGSNVIADRLAKKYQLQIDKDMEKFKSEIARKQHVSVTYFDAEFSLFRDLCKSFSDMLQDIFTIIPVKKEDSLKSKFPMATDELNDSIKELFMHALQASTKSKDLLTANRPFLTKEIMQLFDGILDLSDRQLTRISERYNEQIPGEFAEKAQLTESDISISRELSERWFCVCDHIRDYLNTLEVG